MNLHPVLHTYKNYIWLGTLILGPDGLDLNLVPAIQLGSFQ